MRPRPGLAAALAAAGALACGGGSESAAPARPPGFYIGISSLAFTPGNLTVPPGATVTVLNQDGVAHSVTSASAPGVFTPGAVNGVAFDTDLFTGERTFTVPASAPAGTVVPYYCRSHLGTMTGTVTIDPAAQPGPPPGGGGGYSP
jgi:plastocyanin